MQEYTRLVLCLKRHSDRPECQYSITLCLGGEYDKQWPIWIQDYDGNESLCWT